MLMEQQYCAFSIYLLSLRFGIMNNLNFFNARFSVY